MNNATYRIQVARVTIWLYHKNDGDSVMAYSPSVVPSVSGHCLYLCHSDLRSHRDTYENRAILNAALKHTHRSDPGLLSGS